MKKNILNEVNRVREIMGLSTLLEQENIDRDAADDAVAENPNIYKEFEGGKPYELFLLKATPTSKLYFESTGEGVKDSQRFKYRRKHPQLIQIEKLKIRIQNLDKTKRNYDTIVETLNARIETAEKIYNDKLELPKFDEKYQYTSSKDSFKKSRGGDNPFEENPEFVEGALRVKVEVPLTPKEKLAVMEQIRRYVDKNYKGDYEAAADTKKLSKKTSSYRYYGIKSMKLSPKGIEVKKIEEERPPVLPGFEEKIQLTDGGGNSVFPNNEWEVGDQIKNWAEETVETINSMKSQFAQKGYKDITVEMTDTKYDKDGKVVKIPYTIATSASRIPNGGKAKDLTFLELSEKRAESVKNYLQQVFSSAGIKMIEPIVSFQGGNKDGSSGPEWSGRNEDRPKYEQYKYCKIAVAFKLSSPGLEEDEVLAEPETVTKVGEWNLKITRQTKGRPFKDFITWITSWELPKRKPSKGKKFKPTKIACPAYD